MGKVSMKYLATKKVQRGDREWTYYYFRYKGDWRRLPDINDPLFSVRYQELKAAVEKERAIPLTGEIPGTIAWLIKRYFLTQKYRKLRPSSKRNTDLYMSVIRDKWGTLPVHAIRRTDVEDLVADYHDRPGAMTKLLAAASKLINYSLDLELRVGNPVTRFERPDLGEHEPWPDWLLQAALESDDLLFRRAVHLHYYTGQRTSDACSMAWNAIRAGQIESQQMKKRDKPHIIPIHRALKVELDSAERGAVTILEARTGGSLSPNTFRRWCRAFCEAHEVEGYTPHGLRKNAVTVLLELGCTTAQVAAITDQTLATIEKYARRRNNVLIARQAMEIWGRG